MLKKVGTLFLCSALLVSLAFVALAGSSADAASTGGNPITLVALGNNVDMPVTSEADCWISTWAADGNVYATHQDGGGFGYTFPSAYDGQHRQLCELSGSPEDPSSLGGVNLNPGTLGSTLPNQYITDCYEVDGVLYVTPSYSEQLGNNFVFQKTTLLKSTDGGANWTDFWGYTNPTSTPDDNSATFPDIRFGWPSFVRYGQGGVAPDIDNAQKYVYITSYDTSCSSGKESCGILGDSVYLARILRTDLPSLDPSKIQYYIGGDGMSDSSWTNNSAQMQPMYSDSYRCDSTSIVYNPGLQRYVMTMFNGNCWDSTPIESSYQVLESAHPWGPWTKVLDDNNVGQSGRIEGGWLMQKFISADGSKMWMTNCGNPSAGAYKLFYKPLYFSTSPVQPYSAGNAVLSGGTSIGSAVSGYAGNGYVTGFNSVGADCKFNVNVATTGQYIVNFNYNTSNEQSISLYVNGIKIQKLQLSNSETLYDTWTDITAMPYLNSGDNTIELRYDTGDSGQLNLDGMKLALYQAGLPPVQPVNLALGATASASSTWANDSTYGAAMANDGNSSTRWNAGDGTGAGDWLELDFSAQTSINQTMITQDCNRITGYQIQYWNGSSWQTAYTGGLMWTSAKTDSFPAVSTTKLRLYITSVQTDGGGSCPSIWEFEVHGDGTQNGGNSGTPNTSNLSDTSFATGVNIGAAEIRNDYGNYMGSKITVGNTDISVEALGRYYISGNSGTHTMQIVNAADGSVVPGSAVSVNMSAGSPDSLGFKYTALSTPVTLKANQTYYIVSLETIGGDQWYGNKTLPALSTTTAASINGCVYYDGSSWNTWGNTGQTYIPVNFRYNTSVQDTSFATGVNIGAAEIRNDYGNYMGAKITVGSADISVKELGRYYIPGNSGVHTMQIVNAADGSILSGSVVSVNMNAGSPDSLGFKYAALPASVTLKAGQTYYIVSLETVGGDQWYGNMTLPKLATTTAANIVGAAYYDGSAWNSWGTAGATYIPVNFKY